MEDKRSETNFKTKTGSSKWRFVLKLLSTDKSANLDWLFGRDGQGGEWKRRRDGKGGAIISNNSVSDSFQQSLHQSNLGSFQKRNINLHQNLVTSELLEPMTLHNYCKRLKDKYENKWSGNLYITEKGIIQDEIPIYASLYNDHIVFSQKRDLIQTLKQYSRSILLGEPGSGKTTSIEKLCLDYAVDFSQGDRHNNQEKLIPIIIRLSSYTGSLLQSIRASINSIGILDIGSDLLKIKLLLQGRKCLILFDGLKEINQAYRNKIIADIIHFLNTYPNHNYVITSRPQDELWRIIPSNEIEINLAIQPIDRENIVKYLSLHIGEVLGRLAYREVSIRFKNLLRLPLILWMFKE